MGRRCSGRELLNRGVIEQKCSPLFHESFQTQMRARPTESLFFGIFNHALFESVERGEFPGIGFHLFCNESVIVLRKRAYLIPVEPGRGDVANVGAM
jgi:hypothetical protein